MQLIALRESVRRRTGVPSGDRLIDSTAIDEAVNFGVDQLEAEYRWPWLERDTMLSLDHGADRFPMPPRWRATRSLVMVNAGQSPRELVLAAPVDMLMMTMPGVPQWYAPYGTDILVSPIVDRPSDFRHLWYGSSPYLIADDDQPAVPDEYSGAIVVAAAATLAARENDHPAQAAFAAEYEAWIRRIRHAVRRSTAPVVPRVRAGSWIA